MRGSHLGRVPRPLGHHANRRTLSFPICQTRWSERPARWGWSRQRRPLPHLESAGEAPAALPSGAVGDRSPSPTWQGPLSPEVQPHSAGLAPSRWPGLWGSGSGPRPSPAPPPSQAPGATARDRGRLRRVLGQAPAEAAAVPAPAPLRAGLPRGEARGGALAGAGLHRGQRCVGVACVAVGRGLGPGPGLWLRGGAGTGPTSEAGVCRR